MAYNKQCQTREYRTKSTPNPMLLHPILGDLLPEKDDGVTIGVCSCTDEAPIVKKVYYNSSTFYAEVVYTIYHLSLLVHITYLCSYTKVQNNLL